MIEKYKKPRPRIPQDLQRKVKIESGHKCAVNRCNSTTCEIHHIDGNRENNVLENLIFLCRNHHKQAHEGIIDRKSLIEYKRNSDFFDKEGLALAFYKEHISELDKCLKLNDWVDISDDLSSYRIHHVFFNSFIAGIRLIDNTKYPDIYPDLCDSIERIRDILSNLINHFINENVVLIEGKLNCWMYKRWKAKAWYPQDVYNEMYKEMEIWQETINYIHRDLLLALNSFAENVWKDISPNYRCRQKFHFPYPY